MRVLVVTQYYPPEVTAGAFRLDAFARGLVARGHDVAVLCAVPNHPGGKIASGYRGRAVVRRNAAGAHVSHLWVYARPVKTVPSRLANYGSFAAVALAAGLFRRRPDVIVASSPPLSVGAAGAALAARFRVPLVFDVRDLWPESAVALGELSNGRIVRLAERLERFLYRRAAAVTTANDAFRRHIAERIADASKVVVVANGTTEEWLSAGARPPDRAAAGLSEDEFVWAYAGNIGLAHGLDTAILAAGRLGPGFRLLIIGDGPLRRAIEEQAAGLPPRTVDLRGVMSPGLAAVHLRAADALLVSERQTKTVSAKLYDYAAIGRPIVLAARGEMRRIVDESGIALPVESDDPDALAAAVRRLRDDPGVGDEVVDRARAFAAEHLRDRQAGILVDLLERIGRLRT